MPKRRLTLAVDPETTQRGGESGVATPGPVMPGRRIRWANVARLGAVARRWSPPSWPLPLCSRARRHPRRRRTSASRSRRDGPPDRDASDGRALRRPIARPRKPRQAAPKAGLGPGRVAPKSTTGASTHHTGPVRRRRRRFAAAGRARAAAGRSGAAAGPARRLLQPPRRRLRPRHRRVCRQWRRIRSLTRSSRPARARPASPGCRRAARRPSPPDRGRRRSPAIARRAGGAPRGPSSAPGTSRRPAPGCRTG